MNDMWHGKDLVQLFLRMKDILLFYKEKRKNVFTLLSGYVKMV